MIAVVDVVSDLVVAGEAGRRGEEPMVVFVQKVVQGRSLETI